LLAGGSGGFQFPRAVLWLDDAGVRTGTFFHFATPELLVSRRKLACIDSTAVIMSRQKIGIFPILDQTRGMDSADTNTEL